MTKKVCKHSFMKDQGHSSKKKRQDMKTPKLELEQGAEKRSSGKQRSTKFPFSRPEGGRPKVVGKKLQLRQCGLEVELMEMKGEMRDSKESLLAAKNEANQSQAQLEQLITTRNELITTRNELMDNLLEMKVTEAFLMQELGIF